MTATTYPNGVIPVRHPHRTVPGTPGAAPCPPPPHDHTAECPPFGWISERWAGEHIIIDRRITVSPPRRSVPVRLRWLEDHWGPVE